MENFDVLVIGGGPGGYVAAIRLAQHGKKVAVIEKEHIGGVCLNWGCIPTKSLLKSAEIISYIKHSEEYGITSSVTDIDINKIVDRSRKISGQLTSGVMSLMKKNKITYIEGFASIEKNKSIKIVKDQDIKFLNAKNLIIATGARPKYIAEFEPDKNLIWTSKEAMNPSVLPASIVIVGSGAIGIEFASFYNALGCKVTVLEAQANILPAEDMEISLLAQKMFEKKGIKFITNIKLVKSVKEKSSITIEFESNGNINKITADKLLMAIGITPNTENIGLENTKVELKNSFIDTNDFMQTADPNIYAIGDVTMGPWLAHKASHEGIIAADHIATGKAHKINRKNIPGCTYSSPQIASVGLTEQAAKALGKEIRIGKFPLLANGKALVLGEKEGIIKTIFDVNTGELLGAHMIGAEVTELIQGYVIAKGLETTELDIINTIFAHPTLSESMHEAVLNAYNRAIHV